MNECKGLGVQTLTGALVDRRGCPAGRSIAAVVR